mmetsp:Transcript_21454/g.31886  ORF Transcript_21454/g.31886 Transcript_21454/m.31886 type:complete len:387 (-) Transcript_21454:356-1516(-)
MQSIMLASPLKRYHSVSGSTVVFCRLFSASSTSTSKSIVVKSQHPSLSPRYFSSSSNVLSIIRNNNGGCNDHLLQTSTDKGIMHAHTNPKMTTLLFQQQERRHCFTNDSTKRYIRTRAAPGSGKGKKKKKKVNPKSMIKNIPEETTESSSTDEKIMVLDDKGTAKEKNDNSSSLDQSKRAITYENEAEFDQRNPLLYKRAPHRTFLPRTLLTMTSFHTAYWTWYVLDFIPAMNVNITSSAVDDPSLYIVDPTVGYVGLGLAIFMSIGSWVYPSYLISEVRSAEGTSGGLYIKTHKLPFVTVPQNPGTLYRRKEVTIDNTKDVTKILYDLNGDLRLFNGHLGLRSNDQKANLLLDIRDGEEEVLMEDVLLNSLLKNGVGKAPVKRRK